MSNVDYWNQYTENSNDNEELAKFIRDLVVSLRAQNVLEVGCNSGNDLRLFSQDFAVSGIDSNESAIKKANQNLPNFKFKVGSITELPYEDSSFDVVFTRNVLNYINNSDIEKSVNELFRVSRKYILNFESFSDNESQIQNSILMCGRNMYKRWLDFKVKIISNVDMHEEIDPKKSKFTLVRKI